MSKKKHNRTTKASAGTKIDPNRRPNKNEIDNFIEKTSLKNTGSLKNIHTERVPNLDSKREKITSKIFLTVEIVLFCIPLLFLGMFMASGQTLSSDGLKEYFSKDPHFTIKFLAAFIQPLVAYLLRVSYKRYCSGDVGYCGSNLIVLLCSEMILLSIPGSVGVAVLIWRTWKNIAPHFFDWARERKFSGVLLDILGGLFVLVIAIICAFANWRLSS